MPIFACGRDLGVNGPYRVLIQSSKLKLSGGALTFPLFLFLPDPSTPLDSIHITRGDEKSVKSGTRCKEVRYMRWKTVELGGEGTEWERGKRVSESVGEGERDGMMAGENAKDRKKDREGQKKRRKRKQRVRVEK